ncbi:SAM-dependent methyltransferase [Fangia hongkongensis]|uniref:SAM-dependent methyltransferase n=1 Tax=Fangia hongkongensis TaxID=270495 RepID=UPI00036ECE2B|nr:SAM-dependent methyltransferase [Fangia hongkongensis]MBK2124314.1 SAM-dependent methyltransferase [Fangia hongkongensis]
MTSLSHQHYTNFDKACDEIQSRIGQESALLDIFNELKESALGKFLIEHRGLNAYWTDVMVNYPLYQSGEKEELDRYDQLLLENFPTAKATQERFGFFKKVVQDEIDKEALNILAAPCGLLPEFFDIRYPSNAAIKIDALDLDRKVKAEISKKYHHHVLEKAYQFIEQDIFSFAVKDKYDLVVSNGLNIYIQSADKVKELYQIFHTAMKDEGVLLTSFLTPPPIFSAESPWDMNEIDFEWLMKQKTVFKDILDVAWNCYMTEGEFIALLKDVGFSNIQVIWDKQRIFPTVVAKK